MGSGAQWFGYLGQPHGPTERITSSSSYIQSGLDNSRSLVYPDLPAPSKFLGTTQVGALLNVFVVFFKSPIGIINYYLPWHILEPKHTFFPV